MKFLACIFVLLDTVVNGLSATKFIIDGFKDHNQKIYDNYQSFLIWIRAPENMITKPLPADWIPHSDPKKRTPETEKKF